jgi:hypothetical protein
MNAVLQARSAGNAQPERLALVRSTGSSCMLHPGLGSDVASIWLEQQRSLLAQLHQQQRNVTAWLGAMHGEMISGPVQQQSQEPCTYASAEPVRPCFLSDAAAVGA